MRKGTFDFALYQVEQITAIAVTKCQIQFLNEDILRDSKYMFFCKHSVFQSEARICISFSQFQPQNMLKICLSKNINGSVGTSSNCRMKLS